MFDNFWYILYLSNKIIYIINDLLCPGPKVDIGVNNVLEGYVPEYPDRWRYEIEGLFWGVRPYFYYLLPKVQQIKISGVQKS